MRPTRSVKLALAIALVLMITLVLFWLAPSSRVLAGLSSQGRVDSLSQRGPMITPPPCQEDPDAYLFSPKDGAKLKNRKVLLKWNTLPPLPVAEGDECQVKFDVVVKEGSVVGAIRDAVEGLTALEYRTKKLNRRTVYYWQVKAYNRDGVNYSAPGWFKIKKRQK